MRPFEERRDEFLKRYQELVDELQVDVASMPQYFAIGGGAFGTTLLKDVIDLTKQGVPSPFVEK